MAIKLKYTGTEINNLLDKVNNMKEIEVDSSLSSTSTNPIQNKAVYEAVNDNSTTIKKHSESIKKLQEDVKNIESVTLEWNNV